MMLLQLFIEFFKIGLFAIGGGLASIFFLYNLVDTYHWFNEEMLTNMIAVSEATPGAIGVNMATFTGYVTSGIAGALTATISLVAPSVIIICLLARVYDGYRKNAYVVAAFRTIRPAVLALMAATGIGIFTETVVPFDDLFDIIQYLPLLLFLFLTWMILKKPNIHPIYLIGVSAFFGILLHL